MKNKIIENTSRFRQYTIDKLNEILIINKGQNSNLSDHEKRIRKIENNQGKIWGYVLAITIVFNIIAEILHLVFK